MEILAQSPALSSVPGYREIVERNEIGLLMGPGDLVARNGDLVLTRRGDLMLKNVDHSAYLRLVQQWRLNYPTQKLLFETVFDDAWQAEIEARRAAVIERDMADTLHGRAFNPDTSAWHAANDQAGSNDVAKAIYAGTVTIFLNKSLGSFRSDIDATEAEWATALPVFSGHSLGQVLTATANNVRHNDEWQTATKPNSRQLASMRILAAALNEPLAVDGRNHRFGRDVAPEVLKAISGDDFQRLEKHVFSFTNELLRLREQRRPSL